jgi:hypothetical protein
MSYTFKGEDLINVTMTSDNNMYEAIYKDQNLRINASDLTDGIFNTLKKSNFTVQYPSWGYYRLKEQRFFSILGRKLYLD